MKKLLLFFLLSFSTIFCTDEIVSPEVIDEELTQAEKDFDIAKKMFNPWFGGPLLTGSGNVMPPGYFNFNPTFQATNNHASFDSRRKSRSIDDNLNLNQNLQLGYGLFNRVDTTFTIEGNYNEQSHKEYVTFGDSSIKISFSLTKEYPYIPAMKISFKEVFPTGKYQNLDPSKIGLDSSGNGSFTSEFGFNISKVFWFWPTHPMQSRLAFTYGFPSKVRVKNFNSYGGGYNTDGHVFPGKYFQGSFGYEFAFNQNIVFAIDLTYQYRKESCFFGHLGTTESGSIASVGSNYQDSLSLAPALEYNFTPDLSLVGGVWFSVYGKNTYDFIAGIITFSYGAKIK